MVTSNDPIVGAATSILCLAPKNQREEIEWLLRNRQSMNKKLTASQVLEAKYRGALEECESYMQKMPVTNDRANLVIALVFLRAIIVEALEPQGGEAIKETGEKGKEDE